MIPGFSVETAGAVVALPTLIHSHQEAGCLGSRSW